MNRKINVFFPLDYRKDYSRNDLLDGQNHQINVDQISNFSVGGHQFYLVSGFDNTRSCNITILLMKYGNRLTKVPLLDYGELDKYMKFPRLLNDHEIDSLLKENGIAFSSMPLTTMSNILQQEAEKEYAMRGKKKAKIMVFYDRDGRKFILSSAAKELGFPNPNSIKYLPLKRVIELAKNYNVYCAAGYRLLTGSEYEWIIKNFYVENIEIDTVDVIEYKNNYFVKRIIIEGNDFGTVHQFYDFGENLFDCVPINEGQKAFINRFYSINYQRRHSLTSNFENMPESIEKLSSQDLKGAHFKR